MHRPAVAAALTALVSVGAAYTCQNLTIPISVSARQGVFSLSAPANNIEVTNFILDLTQQGHNLTQEVLTGYQTVSGNYEIAATVCNPSKGPSSVLQILTHGIGFDRSYWNFAYANYNYSYVEEATDQYGYSTFSWDRLGVGQSSHGDPINEIQINLEIAALAYLTNGLKAGSLSGISQKWSKTIHVGHSFGSAETYSLTVLYPEITDGIVLTGFSQNSTFASYFELGGNFIEANTVSALSQYPTGYLGAGDVSGVQTNFFAPGDFDPTVLELAYMTGQPVTPGEILTLGGLTTAPNPFAGPALVITGERDVPYCGGDCYATGNPALASIPAASAKYFASAKPFEAFIVPGAGHGLNLQYTHPTTYGTIFNFLAQNGLAAESGSSSSSPPPTPTTNASATWSSAW